MSQNSVSDRGATHRIGVLLVGVEKLNTSALRFLVLHLNGLQKSFQYEFLPVDRADPLVVGLSRKSPVNREEIRALIPEFLARYQLFLEKENSDYRLKEAAPHDFVLITLARFADEYVSMRRDRLGIVALGNWKRSLAPPSILEFIVTLVVREAVAFSSRSLRGSVHLGTKGCICDFAGDLSEMKQKTLHGFLCSYCRDALKRDGRAELVEDVIRVLDKGWLGRSCEPGSPAGITASLGHDLFLTRGVTPSNWEKLLAKIQEEGIKQLLRILGAIVLALLLLWLGLQRLPHTTNSQIPRSVAPSGSAEEML